MTEAVIITVAAVVTAYDLYVLARVWGRNKAFGSALGEPFVSEVMQEWGRKIYALPFAWGVLGGHFFLNQGYVVPEPTTYFMLFGSLIFPLGFHIFRGWWGLPSSWVTSAFLLVVGAFAGAFLWPMGQG